MGDVPPNFSTTVNRRAFLRAVGMLGIPFMTGFNSVAGAPARRPNILLVMSDDQSWLHASAYGCKFVNTPAFDRVAREGVLFNRAFSAAPGCSPSRAAVLTGRNIWQIEEAAAHASLFPGKYDVYPDILEKAGYHVGHTGKGWGPGSWEDGGLDHNPAGPEYNEIKLADPPLTGIATHSDYLANFDKFLDARPEGAPFSLWVGVREAHRPYEPGSGLRAGKKLEDVDVPAFLSDSDEVRSDLLDYAVELEYCDGILDRLLGKLIEMGELDNTLVVATSDNGMGFSRAKSNLYEFGTRMPLAVRWPGHVPAGRVVDDMVSLIDLAPTFLEAAGLEPPAWMTGVSMMNILTSQRSGRIDASRTRVLTGKERHSHQRHDNLGYPSRALRTEKYLYIRNCEPDRWPGGDAYADLDALKTKKVTDAQTYMIAHKDEKPVRKLLELAYGKRPAEELFLVEEDLACMNNLAGDAKYSAVLKRLRKELDEELTAQRDPRILGYGDIFDSYPRYLSMNEDLPGFKELGKYNPEYVKKAEEAMKRLNIQR
jgi:N-sulfoglucosamine sulfohydrolase